MVHVGDESGAADAGDARVKVRAYIDGFNLYYGGRSLACGASGWKWLDCRALLGTLVARAWPGSTVERIVFCTARVDALRKPDAFRDQDMYLRALLRSRSLLRRK